MLRPEWNCPGDRKHTIIFLRLIHSFFCRIQTVHHWRGIYQWTPTRASYHQFSTDHLLWEYNTFMLYHSLQILLKNYNLWCFEITVFDTRQGGNFFVRCSLMLSEFNLKDICVCSFEMTRFLARAILFTSMWKRMFRFPLIRVMSQGTWVGFYVE